MHPSAAIPQGTRKVPARVSAMGSVLNAITRRREREREIFTHDRGPNSDLVRGQTKRQTERQTERQTGKASAEQEQAKRACGEQGGGGLESPMRAPPARAGRA